MEFGGQTRDTSDARIANATAETIAAHHAKVEATMLDYFKEGGEGVHACCRRALGRSACKRREEQGAERECQKGPVTLCISAAPSLTQGRG